MKSFVEWLRESGLEDAVAQVKGCRLWTVVSVSSCHRTRCVVPDSGGASLLLSRQEET